MHEILLKDFLPADNEYYTPEKWIPHCALAVRLNEEQFQKAKDFEAEVEFPLIAQVQNVALARCNPYKEIKVWKVD